MLASVLRRHSDLPVKPRDERSRYAGHREIVKSPVGCSVAHLHSGA